MYRGRTLSLSLPPFTKAVKWLILINAVIFLMQSLVRFASPDVYDSAIAILALVPILVTHGFVWQLVTYAFLHGGIAHILFNMLALWMFGSQLESEWGVKRFLEFYLFCAIGAALVTIAVSYSGLGGVTPVTKTIGASGGIFGLLMAFGMLFGDRQVFLFPLPFAVKAKYFVAGYGFITLIQAIDAAATRGGAVAYSAHLGGLIFGFLYIKFIPRKGLLFGTSERYFSLRNAYYRWKRRRAARKFEVYMRKYNRTVTFDEHGNYIPPDEMDKKNGGSKSGWIN